METARGGRIDFAFILIQITRQVRQHFVAHVRSISDVLAEQAFRIALGGKRRTKDRKMADQADDLSIPTNPARPVAGATVPPPRVADLSRPDAEPANTPASSRGTHAPARRTQRHANRPSRSPVHGMMGSIAER